MSFLQCYIYSFKIAIESEDCVGWGWSLYENSFFLQDIILSCLCRILILTKIFLGSVGISERTSVLTTFIPRYDIGYHMS